METSAVAACAVRGNFIYLYYRSGQRPLTKPLFVLSPQSFSSSGSNTTYSAATSVPINPYTPSSLSQTNSYSQDDTTIIAPSKDDDERTIDATPDIGPTTAPSSGGDSALFIQVQNTYNSSPSLETLGLQASSISIAATSSFDSRTGIYRYDLLLAFSQPSLSSPLVFQMTAQSPATGNSQDSSISDSTWTPNTFTPPAMTPFGVATQFWLAASASSTPEGSSFYELYSTRESPVLHLSRYDVAKQIVTDVNANIPILADYPTMIKLTGITGFNGAIIGDSSTTATSTGIQFMDSTGSLSFVMTIQDTYDSTACYTSANGQIIKATQGTIETTTVDKSISSGVWSPRSSSNPLPSPILTCAALGNTLYAVVKGGSDGMPMVYTAEMNDWIWRSRQLYNFDNSGGGSGSVGVISTDHNKRSGLSAGSMVGIAVAVVVLGGVGFWWLMRRRRAARDLKGLNGGVEKITVRPPPPGTGGVMVPGQQTYPPAYTTGRAPPPPGSVSISPQLNYHQQVPSSAAGWTTAVYSPSTRAGEHIPMVASSFTTAPPAPLTHINNNMVYSSASSSIPSTPVYSPTTPIVGDKQELTSEDTTILPASSAVGHYQRPSTAMSHNSHQEGSSNTLLGATSQPAGTVRGDNRRQEMFSPALANAQLILQRSQSPPNQTYQELQQPYHR
ncbi:hypothetical protein EC957_007191 [Mortierella hygrophila]|uniref:Uncharacterized protein n=1 Tax=Mortierella hygrophila TaxID=979708 RepID=A0A9P6FD97_9FUNG|nr:hypothetical protein EC957_007191 [Mortierella hygrophila]